jgi:hypothetical protein
MAVNQRLHDEIKQVLIQSLRKKFKTHKPEPKAMPFHTSLLGKDRMALFSFIHSLNTNFGTSMFEPVAVLLGRGLFRAVESQCIAGEKISSEAHLVIQRILDELSAANREPDKQREIEEIRVVCQTGTMHKVKPTKVDVKMIAHSGEMYLIDIKTAKPNAGAFKEFKRTLLEWVAATLAIDPQCKVHSLIAIPYNPYAPKPYKRWTIRGMLDMDRELKVAEGFWNFLGGDGTYESILNIFEEVGIEMRQEIDDYFLEFRQEDNL